jgi:hypothetical protein
MGAFVRFEFGRKLAVAFGFWIPIMGLKIVRNESIRKTNAYREPIDQEAEKAPRFTKQGARA